MWTERVHKISVLVLTEMATLEALVYSLANVQQHSTQVKYEQHWSATPSACIQHRMREFLKAHALIETHSHYLNGKYTEDL